MHNTNTNVDNNHKNHLGDCILNYVILAPAASEVGLAAAVLAPLSVDPRGSEAEFREVTFYAQASQTLQIMTGRDVHFRPQVIPSSTCEPKVLQMVPRSLKGAKGWPK